MKKYICMIIITSFLLSACGSPQKAAQAEQNEVSIAVETQKIEPLSIEQYITVSSKVSAENEISVMPKLSGTVENVFVNLGDEVKKGDILFEIDDTDAQLQVKQAQASLSSAQASLQSAQAGVTSAQAGLQSAQAGLQSAQANYEKNIGGSFETQIQQMQSTVNTYQIQYDDLIKEYESQKQLYEVGAISKQTLTDLESTIEKSKLQLDTAKNELELNQNKILEETKKSSQASIEQSQANVSQSQVNVSQSQAGVSQSQANVSQSQASLESSIKKLNDTKVKSEIDGTISSINISQGSTVNTQTVAMTIVDLNSMKVAFSVSEDVINRISVGSKAYITISAVSQTPFEVSISHISPAADEQTRLYTVEAYIDNTDKKIKSGMFASIKVVLDQKENIISIPLNTVIEKNNEKYVYVVDENNIAHKTIVETGLKNENFIEITNGLQMQDIVVVKGQDFISDGSIVSIVENKSE